MKEFIHILLIFIIHSSDTLRICTRRHFQLVDSHFFQRVELPLPELCVERCIEHLVYCKAAQFTSFTNKTNGVCELHAINSVSKPGSLHPDANLDPLTTVYELLESCPTFVASDMGMKISNKMKDILEKDSFHSIEERKADSSLREYDRIYGEDSIQYSKNQGYALMRTLEDDPKNPFESDDERNDNHLSSSLPLQSSSSSSSHNLPDILPNPITPVTVLHQGRCTGPNCPQDTSNPLHSRDLGQTYITRNDGKDSYQSRDQYITPNDRSPCPARHGDPCAPRPPCSQNCYDTDEKPQRYERGHWSEWSVCSVTCGEGLRNRQCLGDGCEGSSTLPCNSNPCPQWTQWGPFTQCSVTCGEGERRRARICIGGNCHGPSQEMERCSSAPCPEWTGWGEWEGCSVSCGKGKERRFRRCQNGLSCRGSPIEERICSLPQCPYLSEWNEWSSCTVSCGVGETIRTRLCMGNGPCEATAPTEERLLCNQQRCPEWNQWTSWSTCDSCSSDKESSRIRNRVCQYEGRPHTACIGPAQDQSPCPQVDCAHWSEWSDWSDCNQPCGQGQQKRKRECKLGDRLVPQCKGPTEELRFCQVAVCPYWKEWSEWSGCSVTCGRGTCSRNRKCVTDELLDIPNLAELEEAVAVDERMNGRDSWKNDNIKAQLIARSKRILHGDKGKIYNEGLFPEIRRHESNGKLLDQAAICDGPSVESKVCDPGPCCGWREWTEWGNCDGCIQGSMQTRRRECSSISSYTDMVQVSHSHDSYQSPQSNTIQSSSHHSNHPNIIHGGPYDIGGLSPIIPINDPRYHNRHHIVKRRVSIYGDRQECHCDGPMDESRPCINQCLRREQPCQWSQWGEWCGCSPCRPGREIRRRFCERPGREVGYAVSRPEPDCRCNGNDTEERDCRICSSQSEIRTHQIDSYVPISTGVVVSSPQISRHPPDITSSSSYVQPPVMTPQIQVESSTVRDYTEDYSERGDDNKYYRARPRDLPEYAVSRRETPSTTSTTPLIECRWSRWSGWSHCHSNRLKQRSRFCIGAGVPLLSCECQGLSLEETACDPNKESTQVQFIVSDTVREDTVSEDTVKEGSGQIDEKSFETISSNEDKEEEEGGGGGKCKWTEWSQWSDCTVSCGGGEKIRRKRCPCGPNHCGGGVTLESDLCERSPCPDQLNILGRSTKILPLFKTAIHK